MEKITKREMFEALVNLATTGEMTFTREGEICDVSEDALADFATHEIEQLDKKSAKAKEYATKKKASNDELTDAVREALSGVFEPIADIAARIEGEDVTVSKVTYRLTQLVKAGEAEKKEISIPATETSKARRIQGYRIATAESED